MRRQGGSRWRLGRTRFQLWDLNGGKNLAEADLGLVKKSPEAAHETTDREEQDKNKKWG
jgi:hypothetical protein